jgi:hypothetical protein
MSDVSSDLAAENARLRANNESLCAAIISLCDSLERFVLDRSDPGTETRAAIDRVRLAIEARWLH